MVSCSCGKEFATDFALRQHRADKGKCVPATSTKTQKPRPARPPNDSWLWKHAVKTTAIRSIHRAAIEPSNTPVSSTSGSELVCSYNWRIGKNASLHIPGCAAVWQDITLPLILPADEGVQYMDQNTARAPKFPWEPMFQATASMNSTFRFDDVDVLTNRNSLRKLLEFSNGRRQDSFRLNLHLVHRTLIIERYEKNTRMLVSGSRNPGWGKIFEQRTTKYPAGLKDSESHHRSLQYRLGDLVCVVQFEVDGCYDKVDEASTEPGALSLSMDRLSINNGQRDNTTSIRSPGQKAPMAQEMAAELKTASKPKALGKSMPQLWFGRTPWLIVGHHAQGTFTECQITNVASKFPDWEDKNQADLRMLAAVLGQLREAIQGNGGKHCVAICEKKVFPPVIEVFPSTAMKMAVPDNLRGKLWDAKAGGHPTGSSP
ncbi:RAT1-interacting protein [Microdochium nivale]|nr:RAT1-interacting protein [Microdochium nivale]